LNRIEVNNSEQLTSMLSHSRIDLVVVSEAQGHMSDFIKNPIFKQLDYIETFLNGRYFSIPKHSPLSKFYIDINNEVNNMRKNNEITKIFSQYNLEAPIQVDSDDGNIDFPKRQ